MSKNAKLAVLAIVVVSVAGLIFWWTTTEEGADEPEAASPVTVSFSFDDGPEGWKPGFADIPSDPEEIEFYELDAEWRELPDSLGGGGLYSRGSNRSDDLMMYWIVQVEDLAPAAAYSVEFNLEVATNIPSGLVGIGGSPTDSVYLKVGASTVQPETAPAGDGFDRLNIDIGSQSNGGENGVVIGTLDNPNVDQEATDLPPYALNMLESAGSPVSVIADEFGSIWLIVAVDSGFEGPTDIYFSAVDANLTPAE